MSRTVGRYAVTVDGLLDDHHAVRLGDWTLVRNPDGTTTLTGDAVDQARLHGLLGALRDLGVGLLGVASVPPAPEPPACVRTGDLGGADAQARTIRTAQVPLPDPSSRYCPPSTRSAEMKSE